MFVLQEAISPKCHSDRETLTKHANRAEFHCSRKLVAAALAGAFGLRAHSPRRPAAATSTDSNTTAPSGTKSASMAPGKLLSRCTSNRVFLYSSASNQVSEQDSSCSCSEATTTFASRKTVGVSQTSRCGGEPMPNIEQKVRPINSQNDTQPSPAPLGDCIITSFTDQFMGWSRGRVYQNPYRAPYSARVSSSKRSGKAIVCRLELLKGGF
jgi:hypothetical protein